MSIDTDRFRAALLKEREQLQSQIEHHDIGTSDLTGETGELVSSSADNHMADTASETFERELDEGLEEGAARRLREVEDALGRIDDGTYGSCATCGNPIGEERLEAVPWATLCIDDARKQAR
ncbi:MAG TPA: TraR/DksA C4-type zinc finger protein [Gaiellaceae bacterium]|jgi:RNA polymerase-binding protein DksA|nr:TraR/DksA C4-type zinc finger protein [Gaiellaceae bacterium]